MNNTTGNTHNTSNNTDYYNYYDGIDGDGPTAASIFVGVFTGVYALCGLTV
jgi:hypothetical protein